MKVKELEAQAKLKIQEERNKKVSQFIEEKKLELDACKKVYDKVKKDYDELLEMDVNDFLFPHEFITPRININCLPGAAAAIARMRDNDNKYIVRFWQQ